jgi:hypothetical protein
MSRASRFGRHALTGVAALAVLSTAPLAVATKGSNTNDILKVRGGATEVTLDAGAAGALTSLGVSVAPTGKAYATKSGAIRFPITRGSVDAETLAGQIRHAGGLKFSAGTTSLVLDRYHINIDGSPDLSARVNRKGPDRIELFDVDVSGLKVGSEKGRTILSGVKLTLSDDAAAALNATFGVSAFGEGLAIADAKVSTNARERTVKVPKKLRLDRGWTTVALDPGTAGVLSDNGVTVAPVGRAKAGASGISFPITRGKVRTANLAGWIGHRGGLSLSVETVQQQKTAPPTTHNPAPPATTTEPKAPVEVSTTKVTLKRFLINTKTGKLTGAVYVNGERAGRLPLFALGVDNVQTVQTKRFLRVTDVDLSLTKEAADALNASFGVNLFAEGLPVGTAKVRSRALNYYGWYRYYRGRR